MEYLPQAQTIDTTLTVSHDLAGRVAWFGDAARRNGIHLLGGPGSGKSRALGRILAWFDFVRGSPQIILDPTGGTIDNFLDRMILLPPAMQERLWPRVRYVDLGATDYVTPMPLLKRRHSRESWFAVANRPLEVFRRMDPHLATASVEGWNALFEIGVYAGQVAAALGLQVTEMADIIRQPKRWKAATDALQEKYPDLQPALEYLKEYSRLKPDLQRRRSGSLLTKLLPFLADPAMQAVFAADVEGVDIQAVDEGCLTLLVDGRHEHDPVRRQFKLLWLFRLVTDYLKERGMAGRARPMGFVIDEVTQLLGFHSLENTVMAEDLEELVSVLARNYGCNLTIAHQSLTQISSERIRNVLMQMGTQIVGLVHNPDDREYLVRHFFAYDAYKVKKEEPVWMNVQSGFGNLTFSQPEIIDWRASEFTPQEQLIETGDRFRNLPRFHFLVRRSAGEGSVAGGLEEVSIDEVDAGRYPDEEQLAIARQQLRQRDGYPVAVLLQEIQGRTRRALADTAATGHAILEGEEHKPHATTGTDPLPVKGEAKPAPGARKPAPAAAGWQGDLWKKGAP